MAKRHPPDKHQIPPINKSFQPVQRLELLHIAKKCWSGLLKCPACCEFASHYSSSDHCFQWSLQLYCDSCANTFSICTLCPLNKRQFHSQKDLLKHQKTRSHMKKMTELLMSMTTSTEKCVPVDNNEDVSNVDFSHEEFTENENMNETEYILSHEAREFLLKKELFYFLSQATSEKGNEYLFSSTYFPHQKVVDKVSQSDSELNILLGAFLYSLSTKKQILFGEIIRRIKPYMIESSETICERPPYAMFIPFKHSSIRGTYFKGSNSLRNFIPMPKIVIVKSRNGENVHSYMSILDCVEHFVAFGNSIYDLESEERMKRKKSDCVTNKLDCLRMFEIQKHVEGIKNEERINVPVISTAYTVFSDDFDPTVSLVKANRNGIWMLQISVVRTKDKSQEFENTR